MSPSRLKYPVLGALVAAAPATSSAAIVVFDINDVTLSSSSPNIVGLYMMSIDITNGTFTVNQGNSPGIGFLTGPDYNSRFYLAASTGEIRFQAFPPAGSLISSDLPSNNWSDLLYLSTPTLGLNYIGMQLTQDSQVHYGWFEFTKTGTDIILNRFAFENTPGASIVVGSTSAIPEASTLGFAGGLFGLIAAAHLRRRRQKQDAASDRLLALAAGEKLN
jgi:hypothetical protein